LVKPEYFMRIIRFEPHNAGMTHNLQKLGRIKLTRPNAPTQCLLNGRTGQ
jgi:hypothetical protein